MRYAIHLHHESLARSYQVYRKTDSRSMDLPVLGHVDHPYTFCHPTNYSACGAMCGLAKACWTFQYRPVHVYTESGFSGVSPKISFRRLSIRRMSFLRTALSRMSSRRMVASIPFCFWLPHSAKCEPAKLHAVKFGLHSANWRSAKWCSAKWHSVNCQDTIVCIHRTSISM